MFEIPFSDIPDQLLFEISEILHKYSIALIKMQEKPNGYHKATQIGSATLISVGSKYGLLTAYHVTRELDGYCKLGLTLDTTSCTFQIDKNNFSVINIGTPITEEYGPDLSFIALSAPDVSTIKIYRSFQPLEPDREKILSNPPSLDLGIWFGCGSPEERTIQNSPERNYDSVIAVQDFCLPGSVRQDTKDNEYDYLLVDINEEKGNNLPKNYGGMSGGGLWQILVKKSPKGNIKPSRFIFSGVIFYQWLPQIGSKYLRCHGRKSIYKHVYESLNQD